MSYWFDSKHHQKRFYLNPYVKAIDKCLSRVKPPYDISRVPRSIEKDLPFWKASEYRAWLLFYSIPILKSFLPADYIHHLALLVSAVHTLLSTNITIDALKRAECMLKCFYELIPTLYPKELCTMNVHSLIHLTECVRRWGPLWCYSIFGFENMNGFLKRQCHSTKNVLPQMIRSLHTRQTLPSLQKKLEKTESKQTMEFLKKIGSFQKVLSTKQHTGPLGKISVRKVTHIESQMLAAAEFSVPDKVSIFPRYMINRLVVHSRERTREGGTRDNTVCILRSSTGNPMFGSVQTLCGVGVAHIALVKIFENTDEGILADLPASTLEIPYPRLTLLSTK